MARLPVFTETADGSLEEMVPSAPSNEDSLQELIARFPEVISGGKEPLLTISREEDVPDDLGRAGRWSLDNLYVTTTAIPVLVEVKRASDTRIRREVVAQMMDYAANATAYWSPGTLEQSFQNYCENNDLDADLALAAFLGRDSDGFWEQVESNLSAGRIRMLFVADEIPKELARIIEFMNEQMKAEVLGVELVYYEASDGRRTLAPRLVGENELAKPNKTAVDIEGRPAEVREWADAYYEGDLAEGINALLRRSAEQGMSVSVSDRRAHLLVTFQSQGRTRYALTIDPKGVLRITFRWLQAIPALKDLEVRAHFLSEFGSAVGGLNTDNASGEPGFSAAVLKSADRLNAFFAVMSDLISAARAGD